MKGRRKLAWGVPNKFTILHLIKEWDIMVQYIADSQRIREVDVMIKAVFLDYTGTTVQENGREIQEVIMRVCNNSSLHDPKAVLALWWKYLKQYEENSYGETYLTEDEIVDHLLSDLAGQIDLKENMEELHELIRGFWVHAPLFSDVKDFFEHCPVPIYIISNNGAQYVGQSMKEKNLSPEGIICADMVRAYKPHRELFLKALEISGFRADEVVHIGDSYGSDVWGARAAGIRPILIDRKGDQSYEDVTVIHELSEVKFS